MTRRDLCVDDEDPRDGLIAHGTCETLVIKSVPNMKGATKIYGTHMAKESGNSIPGKFYPAPTTSRRHDFGPLARVREGIAPAASRRGIASQR